MFPKTLIGVVVAAFLMLFYRLLTPSIEVQKGKPTLPIPHGQPAFRQRLIAVGDLHGGDFCFDFLRQS